jgi:hypothetical protein
MIAKSAATHFLGTSGKACRRPAGEWCNNGNEQPTRGGAPQEYAGQEKAAVKPAFSLRRDGGRQKWKLVPTRIEKFETEFCGVSDSVAVRAI